MGKAKNTHFIRSIGHVFVLLCIITIDMAYAQQPDLLDRYIQQALTSNIALQREELSYEQSLQALQEAKANYFPTISAVATFRTAQGQNRVGLDVDGEFGPLFQNLDLINSTLYQIVPGYPQVPSYEDAASGSTVNEALNQIQQTGIRVSVPIFNAAIINNHQIKRQLVAVQHLSAADYKDELVKEVKTAYFQWLQAGEVVLVYENALQLARNNTLTAKSLFKNNKVTKDVVYSAEAREAMIDQDLISSQKDEVMAKAFFNFLINRNYDAPIEKDNRYSTVTPLTGTLESYQITALANRKDLQQVNRLQEVSISQIALQKGNYLPQVGLSIDAGYRGTNYSFTGEDDFVSLSAQLKWDLFTFGRNRAKVEQAKIQSEINKGQSEELSQKIKLDALQAYLEADAAYNKIAAAQKEVRSSQQELKLVKKKYELGQASALELESSQNDLQNAQIQALTNKYNYLKQCALLERATASYEYNNE